MTAATEHILVGVSDEGSYDMRYTLPVHIELDPERRGAVEDFVGGYRAEALWGTEEADEIDEEESGEDDEENEASWGSERFCERFIEDLLRQPGVVSAHFFEFVNSFE